MIAPKYKLKLYVLVLLLYGIARYSTSSYMFKNKGRTFLLRCSY